MSHTTQIEVPTTVPVSQPLQGDSTAAIIFAIAFLIKTTAFSIAVIIKANKR